MLATVIGWVVDHHIAGIGFELGFGVLDHSQHDIADRLTRTRLTWFTAENTARARQAIGATGPDLVGLIVYLVTPLLSAVLLPIAIALALLTVSWELTVVALAGVPLMLGAYVLSGALGRRADRAAAQANSDLTERIVEFARTQRAASRPPGRPRAQPCRGGAVFSLIPATVAWALTNQSGLHRLKLDQERRENIVSSCKFTRLKLRNEESCF